MRNNLEVNDNFEASLLGQKKNLTVAAIHTQILGGGFMSLEGLQVWLHEWEDEIKSLAVNSSVLNETEIEKLPELPNKPCLLYTSPSPRDRQKSRMPSSA